MKKSIFFVLLIFALACNNKKSTVDISGVKVDLKLERFEQDFFNIDTNNIAPGINQLNQKYPEFTPVFFQDVLGLENEPLPGIKHFLALGRPVKEAADKALPSGDPLKKDFEKAFRYLKYYFPQYPVPKIITLIGPVDLLAQNASGYSPDFMRPGFIGIGLQFYLGKDFPLYHDTYYVENVAPLYRSRRFSKEYIVADAMKLVTYDMFPDSSNSRPLIEQMIEKGKQWYLLDHFLPDTPDSLKTGYTKKQLNWVKENEGNIWGYFTANVDIYGVDPGIIQDYIGEGPFTRGMPENASPGNIGQWVGWQIIKTFAEKKPELSVQQILATPAKTIFQEAKYKPK